ncbi:MAG TPA: DUF418 domain-containing protein [Pseudomonadales bacterium]|nr:DUF418 domain-containing protein [Pseudomonadales bacterium]
MLPVPETNRIQSLDVLRGFALLGILLLNILGFGLVSASYSNPGFDLINAETIDITVWAVVELFGEGAMRCLFSLLFGAGVLLFTTGSSGKSGSLHYRRTFLLLLFGLFDAYVLLWNGDILTTYAVAGFMLYPLRNFGAKTLFSIAGLLIVLISLLYAGTGYGLGQARSAAQVVAGSEQSASLSPSLIQGANSWKEFAAGLELDQQAVADELSQRRENYASAFHWNAKKVNEMLFFVMPVILLWDALAMMILGMALYKANVLQGGQSTSFYFRLMLAGLAVGLMVNGYEVHRAFNSGFDLIATFAQMQPTYQFGRLGMALGYIGLIVWLSQLGVLAVFRQALAAVGRMALTNYLMQSLICALIFSGLGLALVGELTRGWLYPIVLLIWIFQMWFSIWWLQRFKFGPVEWLWRSLTYGQIPEFKRSQ